VKAKQNAAHLGYYFILPVLKLLRQPLGPDIRSGYAGTTQILPVAATVAQRQYCSGYLLLLRLFCLKTGISIEF